ncbi:MAG: UDP-3-O-acyl-N-acetylglucosamine deacetylase [Armatimonadetes bacterium]|nr:UDP-3-O-acyl-N-acetylglucosamine deacetylase [Armatimonadota bacterium]
MEVSFARKTVRSSIRLTGKGLHSGEPVDVEFVPSDGGIVFESGGVQTRATVDEVTDTTRCTRLSGVSTVEHAMSALAGLGVTDVLVRMTGAELPALDGSASGYVAALDSVGLEDIGTASLRLFERVFYVDGDVRIGISVGSGHWRFDFECGERWPGSQSFECQLTPEAFRREIAGARTFAFEEEVPLLLGAGLGQGLDSGSALVIGHGAYQNPARWDDEPARHKLLDLIGDLYLAGMPPFFLNVVAVKSGHRTNVEAAKRLSAHLRSSPDAETP